MPDLEKVMKDVQKEKEGRGADKGSRRRRRRQSGSRKKTTKTNDDN